MSRRQYSISEYFQNLYKNHRPQLSFNGESKADWQAWRQEALPRLLSLLGEFPDAVDAMPEIEYSVEEDGIIRERVALDTEEHMSVPAIVLRPRDMKPDGSNAAIVCSHGHGHFGKDVVAGIRRTQAMVDQINTMNYDYAYRMAKEGFLTIAPDLRNFGERCGREYPGKDRCNVNFIIGAMGGIYTLTGNIWDIKCCIDYIQTRPEVNPERIGMMGLSLGGTMTAFTTAVEPRIKAADIMGYVNPWYDFGVTDANFCGSQIVPGIYRYFDVADIAGLIAPRPLLVEMGAYDQCFAIGDLQRGYRQVERIYQAAGARDLLDSDVGLCGHAFVGKKAPGFFREHL